MSKKMVEADITVEFFTVPDHGYFASPEDPFYVWTYYAKLTNVHTGKFVPYCITTESDTPIDKHVEPTLSRLFGEMLSNGDLTLVSKDDVFTVIDTGETMTIGEWEAEQV